MRSFFQAAEEGLDDGIVPAAAASTHARLEVAACTKALEVVASILAALVAMHQDPLLRFAQHA